MTGDGRNRLSIGVGARRGVPAGEVLDLIADALSSVAAPARPDSSSIAVLATVDGKADEPGVIEAARRLGVPLRTFPAEVLAAVPVPRPSALVAAVTGTPSVAEAAALAAAGPGATLLVPKRKSVPGGRATCAVALCPATSPKPSATHAPPAPHQGDPVSTPPAPRSGTANEPDLRHHGDREVRDAAGELTDLTDLAVNVRAGTPPAWLKARIAASLDGLAAYPDGRAAREAVAARHGLPPERVLLTAGAAEAFVLIARAIRARHPVVVHPQFTEPEAALRDAGHVVERVLLTERDGFRLGADSVPEDADLVVVGNPTNPTSVLHPAEALARLARPGRTLVVDEAFMDAVPGEPASLASRTDVPGLVVLRSLTKTWGLAGLRVGYVLAAPEIIAALEQAQPLWPVSAPALAAAEACCEPAALAEAAEAAETIAADRAYLLSRLREFPGIRAMEPAAGSFVLIRMPKAAAVRERLRTLGFAARRGDTFPGLGPEWLRLAVRDRGTVDRFVVALEKAVGEVGGPGGAAEAADQPRTGGEHPARL
ncbi:Rv2231c family pyridoxal phosphate-dependent protein CobC [Streptomyces sp. NPDC003077]|uniref:Rv2231c family pyridoxal phosphate-dependent protein CobC n=1 Tax=Streptomyces sp. NPDC003077 TaxID=3154443 RepID=UPI00339DB75A